MTISSVFVFLWVLACALISRADQPPSPKSDPTRPTFSLWEGFDLSLPSQDEIGSFFTQAGDAVSQASEAGQQKFIELRDSPVGKAAAQFFDNAVKTTKDTLIAFEDSGVVADVSDWAVEAASDAAVFVDEARTAFQESQIAFEAQKYGAYVKEVGEYCIRDLAGVEVPASVLIWFSEARRYGDLAIDGFKKEEIPKAVWKWIEEHPTEMETAGWVLKNGVWIALAVNPTIAWSPLLHVLGWGSKGPILGSLATTFQSGMRVVPASSPFSFFQGAAMGGRDAGVMNWLARGGFAAKWLAETKWVSDTAGKFSEKVADKTKEKKKKKNEL